MPGRVKHHTPTTAHAEGSSRKHFARMASAQTSSFPSFSNQGGPPGLSKEAIIWITVLSVVVVATAIIVGILLCRCTCSRKKRAARQRHANGHSHHPSLEVTDGRNDHIAWNRSFLPQGSRARDGTNDDGFEMTPLAKAAASRGREHLSVLPPRPVVVEEEIDPLTPVYSRKKASRYYSGINNAWKRVSQIGKAY